MNNSHDVRHQDVPAMALATFKVGECERLSLNSATLDARTARRDLGSLAIQLTIGRTPARLHKGSIGFLNSFAVLVLVIDVHGKLHGSCVANLFKQAPDRESDLQHWDLVYLNFDKELQGLLSPAELLELSGDITNVVNRVLATEEAFLLTPHYAVSMFGAADDAVSATRGHLVSWGCTALAGGDDLYTLPHPTLVHHLAHPDLTLGHTNV